MSATRVGFCLFAGGGTCNLSVCQFQPVVEASSASTISSRTPLINGSNVEPAIEVEPVTKVEPP
jgi:hypothetical protein